MEFDLKFLISIGGIIASVGGSFAVVRSQVERMKKDVEALNKKLGQLDNRIDKLDVHTTTVAQRMDVISSILSPSALESNTRRIERLRADVDHLMKG